MRCCVPFCKSTQEIISKSDGIRFLEFPTKGVLRSAWSLALGLHGKVPAGAVVCSQHFLSEDLLYEANKEQAVRVGAVPTTVQICIICLEMDSKMFSINKHKFEEPYEHLTGHALYDGGNLKHLLCVECAQRLNRLNEFRQKSLKARALLMELYEKYEVITIWHIAQLRDARTSLKSSLARRSQGTDPCDLHVLEESPDFFTEVEVKIESTGIELDQTNRVSYSSSGPDIQPDCDYNVTLYDENMPEEKKDSNNINEDDPNEGNANIVELSDDSNHDSYFSETLSTDLNRVTPDKNKIKNISLIQKTKRSQTRQQKALLHTSRMKQPTKSKSTAHNPSNLINPSVEPDTLSDNESLQTWKTKLETQKPKQQEMNESKRFICDLCDRSFKLKCLLAKHMPVHYKQKYQSCTYCDFKSKYTSNLNKHVMIHTGEKPFWCKLCNYRCARKGNLDRHMRIHTRVKPFQCQFCEYKCSIKSNLLTHIRTHTGERPYQCKLCTYRCAQGSTLMYHMKHHIIEKPFACQLCSYKCKRKANLRNHVMIHIGLKLKKEN